MADFSTNKEVSSRRRVTKPTSAQQLMDIGKIPPQAVELEEAVLGAVMLESDSLAIVIDILQPESFYKDVNSRIWLAITRLFSKSSPVDILTVTQELKSSGELEIVGGAYYITQLTNRVSSAANSEFHARIVAQKFIQRELIRISSDIIRESYEESADVFEQLDKAEQALFSISKSVIKKEVSHVSKILHNVIKELELKETIEQGLFGVPSGITSLDRNTGGWQKSDLIIIAARPAMGKTALVLTMASNASVKFKRPTAIFSLEMSEEQLITRLISSETEISNSSFKRVSSDSKFQDYEWHLINDKVGVIAQAPLYIDDTPRLSIFELRAKARRLKEHHKIELIIIDYLQLMNGGGEQKGNGNREQEIANISRSLKALAKELNIPIIALSQLSRAVETRGGDKRPVLSDLRESGAIEQDADIVMFIHRPSYYGITEDRDGNDCRQLSELIIAKHRNGPVDSVKAKYEDRFTRFTDWEVLESTPDKFSDISRYKNETFTESVDSIEDDKPF